LRCLIFVWGETVLFERDMVAASMSWDLFLEVRLPMRFSLYVRAFMLYSPKKSFPVDLNGRIEVGMY
jgi:hypothetical protein